ncbi:nucleoside triphosphate pyrophosphohydrolase family protein [Candidatus Uhrbacteria bacterium]|nr:nucleoside triphosphate pyrophosphohydrolase family protein [Candidatus Uhrbacteria bacterium]
MDFNEYQKQSRRFVIYPNAGENITYPTLGLANEAGEVAGKVKKVFRDGAGVPSEEQKSQIVDEIGDVLWYCAQLATELGVTLNTIATHNIEKLSSRLERGQLGGSGDKR